MSSMSNLCIAKLQIRLVYFHIFLSNIIPMKAEWKYPVQLIDLSIWNNWCYSFSWINTSEHLLHSWSSNQMIHAVVILYVRIEERSWNFAITHKTLTACFCTSFDKLHNSEDLLYLFYIWENQSHWNIKWITEN